MPHDRPRRREAPPTDVDARMPRRRFGATAGSLFAAPAFGDARLVSTRTSGPSDLLLTARMRPDVAASLTDGALGLGDGEGDVVIDLPSTLPRGRSGVTCDAIRGASGEYVAFLNRAHDHVFAGPSVDPARVWRSAAAI